jgi:surface antigen
MAPQSARIFGGVKEGPMRIKVVGLALVSALSLAACAQPGYGQYGYNAGYGGYGGGFQGVGGYGPKQTVGGLIGAGTGALIGSQFGSGSGRLAATAGLGLLGALLGSQAGQSLDRADQAYLGQSAQQGFEFAPSGAQVGWQNPNTANYGAITPQPAYQTSYGTICREFNQVIVVGGQQQSAYGTACRQPDGSWRVVQ